MFRQLLGCSLWHLPMGRDTLVLQWTCLSTATREYGEAAGAFKSRKVERAGEMTIGYMNWGVEGMHFAH